MAATVLEDVASLVILSLLLQLVVNPTANSPLPLFYGILILSLLCLRWGVPKIRTLLTWKRKKGCKEERDEGEGGILVCVKAFGRRESGCVVSAGEV